MAEPNPLAGMPLAESLANNMNESLQWMSRLWSGSMASPLGVPPSGLPSMMMPTLDPQELERRIADLRTVQHWLDMNRALLHSTIQALEMQRDALVALRTMAQPMTAATESASSALAAGAATAKAASAPETAAATVPPFDATAWWNALHQQFARVAAAAAQPSSEAAPSQPSAKDPATPESAKPKDAKASSGKGKA